MLGSEYATLIALEPEAESAGWYAAQIVPGLLQTEEYAREIIRSTLLISPPGEIERRVQVRMSRQRVLTRDDPLRLSVVLDEAALLRQVGGAEVMRGQLRHLVQAAGAPGINLQVLPNAAGAHPAITGEFTILRFPELIAPDVVYLENMTSNIYVEREAEVFRYSPALERLSTVALGQRSRLPSSPGRRMPSNDHERGRGQWTPKTCTAPNGVRAPAAAGTAAAS